MKTSVVFLLALGLLCLAAAKPHNEGKRSHLTKRNREHKLSNRMEHGDHHRREHGPAHKLEMHRADGGHKKDGGHDSAHHGPLHKLDGNVQRPEGRKGGAHRGAPPTQHDLKKDLHLQHITEHNLEKNHDDKQRRGEAVGKHLITNRVPRGEEASLHLLTNRTPHVSTSPNTTDQKAGGKGKNGTKDGIPMESERLIHVTPRPPRVHKVNKTHHKPSPASTTAAVAPSTSMQASTPSTKAKVHKPPKKYSPKKHGWKKSGRKEKGKDKVKEKKERRDKRNKALHRAIAARKL
ncbi:uncharacterized protein [Panulirus ornatus]|uniref:uncharacterized protein isoform X2 n=1 Tax=Panulirus ornatus TaxID=150431 RepID=UPI003A8C4D63